MSIENSGEKKISRRGFIGGALTGVAAMALLGACGKETPGKSLETQATPEPWELNEELYREYIDSIPTEEQQLAEYVKGLGVGQSPEDYATTILKNLDYWQNLGVDERLFEIFGENVNTPEGHSILEKTIDTVTNDSNSAFRHGMFHKRAWDDTSFAGEVKTLYARLKAAHEASLREAAVNQNFIPVERNLIEAYEIVIGHSRAVVIHYEETGGVEGGQPLSASGYLTIVTNEASGETPWAENGHAEYAQILGIGLVETKQTF